MNTPRLNLVRTAWGLTAAIAMFELVLTLSLERPFNITLIGMRILVIASLAAICHRWSRSDLEGASIAFISSVSICLSALILSISGLNNPGLSNPGIWQSNGLEALIWSVIGGTTMFNLSVLYGWRGLIGGIILAGWPLALQNDFAKQIAILGADIICALTGTLFAQHLETVTVLQRELEKRANSDSMTRLGNRSALDEDYRRYRANAKRWGVPLLLMAWDVDGLKRINDLKGHAAGDMHLLAFVQALRSAVRQGDGLYRIGGDEFITLHPGLTPEDAEVIYRRVHKRFTHVSAGWIKANNDSLDAAKDEADAKLYEEKENRRALIGKRTPVPGQEII
jgi:diguanylate cyclase (GGDEF)-like protein